MLMSKIYHLQILNQFLPETKDLKMLDLRLNFVWYFTQGLISTLSLVKKTNSNLSPSTHVYIL